MRTPPSEQPWEGMLGRAAAGDAEAWRSLVHAYSPRVYGLMLRQCGDGELAEELTQATFVRLVRSIGRYQELGRFEAWLFRIAMNLLRDEMRRRKRHPANLSAGADRDEPTADLTALTDRRSDPVRDDPLERITRAEQIDLMNHAVSNLSPPEQLLLQMRHTAGMSFPQIAEALSQPLGTVLARGHRALAKLRTMMNAHERTSTRKTGSA